MRETIETNNEGNAEFSFQHPFHVLMRHKKKVVLCFAALMALTVLAALSQQAIYRSEAKLLVQVGRESVALDPTASTGRTVDVRQDREEELRAELAILRSPDLPRLVARSVGPEEILNPSSTGPSTEAAGDEGPGFIGGLMAKLRGLMPSAVTGGLSAEDKAFFRVREAVNIKLEDDSSVLALSLDWTNPRMAQHLLDNLIERFQERHLEIHQTPGSYEFFAEQSKQFERELLDAEEELRAIQNEAGFASIDDLTSTLLERLGSVTKDLDATDAGIGAAQSTSRVLQEILAGLPETVVLSQREADSNPTSEYFQQRLGELQLEERSLAQNFKEDSVRMRGIREQIRAAEGMLFSAKEKSLEITEGPNDTRQAMELELLQDQTQLKALRGRRDVLIAQRAQLQAELEVLNTHELEVTRLERKIEGLEKNYLRYAESFEQARVGQALELGKISNIRVIQSPTLPLESSGRGRGLTLKIGALFSLLGALSLAFLCELLDASIKTTRDVSRRLGLATLASVPNHRLYRWKTTAKAVAEGATSNGHSSPLEFVALADLLLALDRSPERRGIVVGLTSTHKGEGVSTVAAHLAAALAQHSDGPVLLVDAELERPRVHHELNVELSPGLAEYLAEPGELPLQDAPIDNLKVLSAGRGGYPQELLKNGRFETLLNAWRLEYDYVIIDMPALSEPRSATRLAGLCDRTMLVIAAETHAWQVVEHGRDQLARSAVKLEGAILNKRRYPDHV